ncbi:MAG: NYN domain-containing protein [Erysipelotrichaceae bacterium]|nr:NYN domain-containing protein [Erysipelotrichaceae bacterium]
MSRIIIGVYAHVDAGKTTLSEAILHRCRFLNKSGRVDHEDSFLDFHDYERKKGITVYTKEARFSYKDKDYIYLDTPGHLDFVGEINRSFLIPDLAILLVDASGTVPADTIRRFHQLKALQYPLFIFLNKMDAAVKSEEEIIADLKKILDPSIVSYRESKETTALNHEELLDKYLNDKEVDERYIINDLKQGELIPVFSGSALHEEGIDELLDYIDRYVEVPVSGEQLKAYIYKVDDYAHLKVFSGTLHNRDVFSDHKISEIVQFNGSRKESVQEVKGNDLCAVKGLQGLKAGTYLPSLFKEEDSELNTMTYALRSDLDNNELYRILQSLNDEFPELKITLNREVTIDLLGELQKDFISDLIEERFKIEVDFSEPLIDYCESIEEEVYGVGHYEPLRHYAEVLVRLTPADTFKVKGRKEDSVLLEYLKTYRPCGILTDSPLDMIEIEIVATATHLKHTEGGDLVQALNRAIRQALSKAKNYLLEPYYLVSFSGDQKSLNGIISELSAAQYTFDVEEEMIMAKIDKRSYNELILILRNRFKDDFSYAIEGHFYDRCRNEKDVIEKKNYDYLSDQSKPVGSVFTRSGAGVYIPPEEVEENMHILLRDYFADYKPAVVHRARSVNEEELKRVWNSLYKPRPRYIEKRSDTETERKTTYSKPKDLLYLIDGYNVMHAMDDIPLNDLISAREKVIDLVCDFSGYVSAYCVLVFDAYLQDSGKTNVSRRDNISIVYTRSGQTADMYIEQQSEKLKDEYRLIVVTSDAMEQYLVFAHEAQRLSSREFLARYQNMRKNVRHEEKSFIRPLEELRKLLIDE